MKKIIVGLTAFLVSHTLFALPVRNPAEPLLHCYDQGGNGEFLNGGWGCLLQEYNIRIGYSSDMVFQRNLKIPQSNHVIRWTKLHTDAGYLSVNFQNRFDVFATIGATDLSIHTIGAAWSNDLSNSDPAILMGRKETSWSIGGRAILMNQCNWIIGVACEYFSARPKIEKFNLAPISWTTSWGPVNRKVSYQEWQGSIGIAYQAPICSSIFTCIPYLAIKGSHAFINTQDINFWDKEVDGIPFFDIYHAYNMKSNKVWGCSAGITIGYQRYMSLNIEGRWGDETALYMNGQISF